MRMRARCGCGGLRYLLCKERRYRHDCHSNACAVGIADPDACACGDPGSKYAESVGVGGSGGKQRDGRERKQLDKRIRQRILIWKRFVFVRRLVIGRQFVIFIGRFIRGRQFVVFIGRLVIGRQLVVFIRRLVLKRQLIVFFGRLILGQQLVILVGRLGSGHNDSRQYRKIYGSCNEQP